MTLLDAREKDELLVKDVCIEDEEVKSFLFTLGCYSGEKVTVLSRVNGGCIVMIKEGRYNLDAEIAGSIEIDLA